MKNTGIKATAAQIETLKSALNRPLIALNAGMPASPQEMCHRMALEAGLPEIKGYYGIDLRTGEFVTA